MTTFSCQESNQSPSWSTFDIFLWKAIPSRFGGGIGHIQRFKDAWVQHNKALIKSAAKKYGFPPELLAGICWVEVGGDPEFIDRIAFEVRAFFWSSSDWVNRNITITHPPERTSFGAVSMQLRTAANTLGIQADQLSIDELSQLASCLQQDVFNIDLAARHVRQIIDHDKLQKDQPELAMEHVRIVGARYNRGLGLSLEAIRKNTSYGDFIVKRWAYFAGLL